MINLTEQQIMKKWKKEEKQYPVVSIRCCTYNHESFIEEAIDGFLFQETNFPFEIIIHDDASTDKTALIIKQYEKKYPSIIKAIYETKNQYSVDKKVIGQIMNSKMKGKYIAWCEGDDYWCDSAKLQKQVDYMESHPSCSLYLHNGYNFDNKTGEKSLLNPYPKSMILLDKDIIIEKGVLPPTASMLTRFDYFIHMPDFFNNAPVGDRPLRMYMILKGEIYYSNDAMCVYRTNIKGSFNDIMKNDKKKNKLCLDGMLAFFHEYNLYTNYQFKNEIDYIKSREYFDYYLRCGNKNAAINTIYFKKHFSTIKKLKLIISLYIPENIKKKLKKFWI